MSLPSLTNSWHLVIAFLGSLGTVAAVVQTNSDLTGSGTPGWTYLVGLGLSALTTLLVAKKSDPRVQQAEALISALNGVIEKANAAPAATPAVVPVPIVSNVNDIVTAGTNILDEINKVIQTFNSTKK